MKYKGGVRKKFVQELLPASGEEGNAKWSYQALNAHHQQRKTRRVVRQPAPVGRTYVLRKKEIRKMEKVCESESQGKEGTRSDVCLVFSCRDAGREDQN